ncbi:MAG: transcription-repair coupling factor [Acidimicrobiia bacterium]|nr:transcription-repair coupling factor [Acidimicrobiia bacterium]
MVGWVGYDARSVTAPLSSLVARWDPEHLPSGRVVVPPEARAFVIAGIAAHAEAATLVVVPAERDAEDLADDVGLFLDSVYLLPAWETLPFEHVSPNVATMAHRAEALHQLTTGGPQTVVIASVRSVTQRVSPSSMEPLTVEVGDDRGFDVMVGQLVALGYHRTDRVEARGEFAVRGGIIDVYPAQADTPVRLDFWGDEVEELQDFSLASQRSVGATERLVAYPAREFRPAERERQIAEELRATQPWAAASWDRIAEGVMFQGIESWLPWLTPETHLLDLAPRDVSIAVLDPVRAAARSLELVDEEAQLAAALASTWGEGAPEAGEHPSLYLEWADAIAEIDHLSAPPMAARPGEEAIAVRSLDAAPGDPESVALGLNKLIASGIDVVVAMDGEAAAARVVRLLGEHGLTLPVVEQTPEKGSVALSTGIHAGFVMPELGIAVLGEREIAGRRRSHRRPSARKAVGTEEAYRDLEVGDFVVHRHHGIGRFEGLVHQEMAGTERDYLLLSYLKGDKLYVPTDQLEAVTKYTGGETPRLSRMGGTDWSTTRAKVRKEIAIVAEQVVELHKRRAAAVGHAFAADTPWQQEFEASFPFEETPDQLQAIEQMKVDMQAAAPMDRLVFGDVGFGKTEVALRGAFKAVQDGKQVAVLVPTTLLAQQHHATFSERFAPYPTRVEVLSRFLTPKQQREVVAGLADGTVDVVVGTHRLLSQDIVFKDLGLVVVDEEQRFGVTAKDALKKLRTSVDVLTLTATPIPRTLEMALTGVREVSHIRTPPEDRHPILTYVGPFDEQTISAAVRRELLREGQVFYVHNRIQSIDHAVARLKRLVPDARYAVAHGRMSEGQLEQVMFDFWNGDYDVLVATTIIESGLDLPQVNTLIVERADRLGLAQLYQLRGRVGRSSQRAYAYLMHPADETLSEDAYRRLEAIGEHSDLGSGFHLAMRDLEIRGAGSMLSEVQSGHIAAVGFDLYVDLVANAVQELKGERVEEEEAPEIRIDLPIDAHLPEEYVATPTSRLEAYRRLAVAHTHADVDDVVAEWIDRYGALPPPAEALIDLARLRVEAIRVGLTEIVKVRHEVRMSPVRLATSQEVRLQRLARRAVLRDRVLFLPAPRGDLVAGLYEFIRTMWPPQIPEETS